MSGNRTVRRGDKDPENYIIIVTERRINTAMPLLDENERELREGQNVARFIEGLGYEVRIERN